MHLLNSQKELIQASNQAKALLLSQGVIADWYLRPSQLILYQFIKEQKRPFIETCRRWGKTTTCLTFVLEELIKNPGWICRILLPFHEQARKIWLPELDKIQQSVTDNDKFIYKTVDSVALHSNGSRIFFHGADMDKLKSARGTAAHIAIADEYGFFSAPQAIKTVIAPQLRTTKGKLIIVSTPPEDLGHAYYEEKALAIRENRFIQRTIYDDETLFDRHKNCIDPISFTQIIKDSGGRDSAAFKREYLCLPVSNPERLVIPEFDEAKHVIKEYKRPEYFDSYVAIDLGFNDCTALLFCYYDFFSATILIEKELVFKGKNSKEIVEKAKQLEKELWVKPPYLRVCDNDLQQIYDMLTLCQYQVIPTAKDDKLAAINALRLRFNTDKIKIHESCVNLIYQLKTGLWNEKCTGYLRGESTGHLDAIDALVYLNRNINQNKNPYPIREPDMARDFSIKRMEYSDTDFGVLTNLFKPIK